jgi:exopolyphosphatase / guanosine-5'-triphosphate,3'-diphosphate pyrophosphatase
MDTGMIHKAAALDVGTNSIKIVVGQINDDGVPRVLREATTNPRLGEGVDETRRIDPDAQERAMNAIGRLVGIAKSMGAAQTRIVATSAVREAANREELIDRVRQRFSIGLEVLSEEEEARLSHLAVEEDPMLGRFDGNQATVDVGGGSTELTLATSNRTLRSSSVKLGAVRLTERFLDADTPTVAMINEAKEYAIDMLFGAVGKFEADRIVGIGGTAVNLARIWHEIPEDKTEEAHGSTVTHSSIKALIDGMCALTLEKRRTLVGLEPERADIIVAGAVIFDAVLDVLGRDEMIVSTRGLRHGILYELLAVNA